MTRSTNHDVTIQSLKNSTTFKLAAYIYKKGFENKYAFIAISYLFLDYRIGRELVCTLFIHEKKKAKPNRIKG